MSLLTTLRAPLAAALLAIAAFASTAPAPALAQASAPAAAEAAAPAIKPPAAEPAVAKETVDNPYGLGALWTQGDFVARGTLVIMIIMSMGSWYIIFTKLFEQSKLMKSAKLVGDAFWKAGSMKQAAATLDESSAYRYIAEQGVKADDHHEGTLVEQIDRHTWISMSIDRAVGNIASRMQDGLAFLATVGSTAPFVGLFGTVWGIYHALAGMAEGSGVTIDKVAGPVGEALIMTAAGLAVAIPAVLAYNVFGKWISAAEADLVGFAHDLREMLLGGPPRGTEDD